MLAYISDNKFGKTVYHPKKKIILFLFTGDSTQSPTAYHKPLAYHQSKIKTTKYNFHKNE